MRLKFRLKADGVLFGWDIERDGGGISKFDMPGGTSWRRGTEFAERPPTRIELPDGEVQLLAYGGPQGQGGALAMSSNAGWARWLARPEPGVMPASAPAHVPAPAPEPAQAPPWADEQRIIDDFGRLVAMHTQTTGWELRSYDAQDQIVARHTSDGTDWRWQRDALGNPPINHCSEK